MKHTKPSNKHDIVAAFLRRKRKADASQVAQGTGMTRQDACRVLCSLKNKGWVRRLTDPVLHGIHTKPGAWQWVGQTAKPANP